MSRFTFWNKQNKEVAYGFSQPDGYFLQVFKDKDNLSVDMDSSYGDSRSNILEAMIEAGVTNEDHLQAIAMDLPY